MCPHEPPTHSTRDDEATPDSTGQRSELTDLQGEPEPVAPEDATAGYPPSESGHADEGTAGPNAAPRHDPPKPGNETSR